MQKKHQIYLISDSTGETLDRIFTAIKVQFTNFYYESHQLSFIRTKNQVDKALEMISQKKDSLIFRIKYFKV